MSPMRWFFAHWPRVGLAFALVLGAALAAALVADTDRAGDVRFVLAVSLLTLLLHQTEEYVRPGGFPQMVKPGDVRQRPARPVPARPAHVLDRHRRPRVLVVRDDLVSTVDVVAGVLLGMAINYLGVVRLIVVLGRRDTAYPFPSS